MMDRNLILRIVTAVVGLPIVIGAALWHVHEGWLLLGLVVLAGVLWEYGAMAMPSSMGDRIFMVLLGTLFAAFLLYYPNQFYLVYGWAALAIILASVFSRAPVEEGARRMASHFFAVFYIAQSLYFLMRMHGLPAGGWWILYTLAVVWTCDTGAYVSGRLVGKHRLAPRLSPKKTWEGAVGGTILAVVAGVLFAYFQPSLRISLAEGAGLALFASVMGQIGDLAESLIKRSYGVKDSGTILPGHGGLFDRVDALLAASPVVFGFVWLQTMSRAGL